MHYIESICEAEKWACDTLQGLFDTLSAKFWLQFNETIKLLQFRKLCRVEDESAEEWMGHLCMAAAECGYKEIDQQLKEQFIHRLNDRVMLDDIIRELTSKTNSEQTTSKDVLAWAKRVKAQSMQASVLNDITETKTFDKIKNAPESKNTWGGENQTLQHTRDGHAGTVGQVTHPHNAQHMEKHALHVARQGTIGRYVVAKETTQCMKWK